MLIPGFQVYANDPAKPKARPFDMVLYHDGEPLDSFATDTDISDDAICSLVNRWKDGHHFDDATANRLENELRAMRDAR